LLQAIAPRRLAAKGPLAGGLPTSVHGAARPAALTWRSTGRGA